MKQVLLSLCFLFFSVNGFGQNEHVCCKRNAFANMEGLRDIDAKDDVNIDITHTRFDWTVDPNVLFIKGSATLTFKSLVSPLERITLSLSTKIKVDSIISNDLPVSFSHSNQYDLSIFLNDVLMQGQSVKIKIYYSGTPSNNGFGAYSQGQHGANKILWTFSVPYAAKEWWPCKNGNSDKLDSMEAHITIPKGYAAAGNGKLMLIDSSNQQSNTFIWKH